jgi:hypothetical protein
MPKLTLLLFLLSISSQTVLKAQGTRLATDRSLSVSGRRVVFESAAFSGPSTALPQWDNGYLITYEIETFQPGMVNAQLRDQTGAKVREAAIWFPGSQRVVIFSATATRDGRIVAGGEANKSDGTTSSFIASTDLSGRVKDVIQTGGFYAENICLAPDGSVWSFGGTGYDEHSEPNPGDTLRHFDFQKGQLGSYLPRPTFPKYPSPEVLSYIRCSSKEVVGYSGTTHKYLEMPYGAAGPHVYDAEVPSGLRLAGFATTGSKQVYALFNRAGKYGLYYLSFNDATATANWLPVKGTFGEYTEPGVIIGLWGSDGDQLLVSRGEDPAGSAALHWATPLH